MTCTPSLAERQRDLARDVMRAFDEVADRDDVADALAAVLAQLARMVPSGHREASGFFASSLGASSA